MTAQTTADPTARQHLEPMYSGDAKADVTADVEADIGTGIGAYDPEGDVDLPGFAGSLATYTVLVTAALLLGRASGRRLPERVPTTDLVLAAVAVHKASRLVAKASVTSPLRAPFTRFEGAAGSSEHNESAREDSRWRHTVGELVTCPFCMDVWLATICTGGLVLAPRHTRGVASLLAVVSGADWLQQLYQRLKD